VELAFDLGVWGILLTAFMAVVYGFVVQLIGEARFSFEWVVTAIAAFAGALIASEWVVAWQAFEPIVDGLSVVPALIGGLVTGAVVGGATRLVETRTLRPHGF